MIRTTPARRITLQCSQRVLIDGLTFILCPLGRGTLEGFPLFPSSVGRGTLGGFPSPLLAYLNRYVIRPRVRS